MEEYAIITIYGSNTDILENGRSVKTPSLSAVQALGDVQSYQLKVLSIDAEPSYDGTTIKKWDFSTFIRNRVFWSAKPTGIDIKYEEANKCFEDFYGTDITEKEFLWVHIPDYVLMPRGMTNDKVLAICISGASVAHTHEQGTKAVSFNMIER